MCRSFLFNRAEKKSVVGLALSKKKLWRDAASLGPLCEKFHFAVGQSVGGEWLAGTLTLQDSTDQAQ